MSRRRFLAAAAVTGSAVITGMTMSPRAAASVAPSTGGSWHGRESANGWPLLDQAHWHALEGSGQKVALADGDAALILTYVARRFHYEIDELRPGDLYGHMTSGDVEESYESNYLSGSALAIRPQAYPAGVTGGLYAAELVVVRDILAELDGAVTWGGAFSRPKESHFELAYPPAHPTLSAAAHTITKQAGGVGRAGA